MSVDNFVTENFRNLVSAQIVLHPKFNFIIGQNGSGKSSLLEALFFLGHGKSFRTNRLEHIVSFSQDNFIVSAKDANDNQLGLSKNISNQVTKLKLNGEITYKLSNLVEHFAVQIVTPESFKLFFGGPKERRKFIDLGMFHVKHDFSGLWRKFNQVLKQRNAGIKNKFSKEELEYWNNVFCESSLIVAQRRAEYVELLEKELNVMLGLLLPTFSNQVSIQYLQGWPKNRNLNECLQQAYDRELAQGFSTYGAHRFDVRFLYGKHSIEACLSRGQQKLFLLALTFAQAKLIEKVKRLKPILLIDDIGAELDANSRTVLADTILQMNCQAVITAIDEEMIKPFIINFGSINNNGEQQEFKMFHVEHGKVIAKNEIKMSE